MRDNLSKAYSKVVTKVTLKAKDIKITKITNITKTEKETEEKKIRLEKKKAAILKRKKALMKKFNEKRFQF